MSEFLGADTAQLRELIERQVSDHGCLNATDSNRLINRWESP